MFIKLFLKSNRYFNIIISLFTVPMDMRVAMIGCTDRMLRSNGFNNMATVLYVLERTDKFEYKYDNTRHE